MERTTRTLERAFAHRESQHDAKVATIPSHHPANVPPVDFTETVIYKTPVVELDATTRTNACILPPGATGPFGGAYKMLRTQVLRKLDKLGANTLGVISAGAAEGKTLTAINLAIAIAADPSRTALLVDFDLRNPSIQRRFNYQPAVGIEECIEQRLPVREAMFKVAGYERLTIAAARSRCEHSSELLASAAVAEMVTEMRTRYANRIVIFDMPPALKADDALAFSRHLQAGLLVVGDGKTRRDDLTRTLELLRDLTFVGTVLNGAREKTETYY